MNNVTNQKIDDMSRNRIVSDMNNNFFVIAGAGSGKTTMLVSRMVAMVEAGCPVEKICAITFTKAAAREFYERFQALLSDRSNPDYVWEDKGVAGQLPKPTLESRNRCAEALKNIDLCFMETIDSFCSMVLSEHPSEAGILSSAGIVSDQEAELFYKKQYKNICSGEYGDELAKKASVFDRFHNNAADAFVRGMLILMDNRNVHFNYPEPGKIDIDETFATERMQLVKALKCLVEHPELKYSNQKSDKAWEKIKDIYRNIQGCWSRKISDVIYAMKSLKDLRVLSSALDQYGELLSGVFVPKGSRRSGLECSACGDDGLLSKLENIRYSVSMDFLKSCVLHLAKAMHDEGKMTFFDYLFYLREMLRKDAEKDGKLIQYIYDRHSYFLIDEFQDTNPLQAEIFFYLASANPKPQWSECVPRPGSLFIVGDPKQSIYRFRGADVTSFLNVKTLFEKNGGEILSLSKNFRSTADICKYFNNTFKRMLPEETSDQSKFEEIPLPIEKKDEFQGAYTYTAYTGKLEEDHPGECDPVQIEKIIATLVGHDKFRIRAKGDKEPRNITYSDIMVITYGKGKLAPIMKCLNENGIPTRVEGAVPFGECETLREIVKIFASVVDADDAISLYGALTGKIIGLTQKDLLCYKNKGGKISLNSHIDVDDSKDEEVGFVASKISELKKLHDKSPRYSSAELFSKILNEYRVFEKVVAENLEIVYYTLELLRNAERTGVIVSLKDGVKFLTRLLEGKSGEERCLSLGEHDAVHMANLHKVKGLEAPVVILAAAVPSPASIDKRIVHEEKCAEGFVFKLVKKNENNNNGNYFETKAFANELEAERNSSKAEDQRLVYVAATRARNALIICDSVRLSSRQTELHQSRWKELMDDAADFFETVGCLDAVPRQDKKPVSAAELYKVSEETCALKNRDVEQSSYSIENPSHQHTKSKLSEDQIENANQVAELAIPKEPVSHVGLHSIPDILGTMTHKLMEMLVSTKNQLDVSAAVIEIIREFRVPESEPYEKELEKALNEVVDKMRSGGYAQGNGVPQDILDILMKADEVYCEVPFCYSDDAEGKVVWHGIMDVIYCADGKWHIVDYKTNADGSDLDKKYQAQLNAYVKAFKETTGNDADAKTYHIAI